MVAFKHDAGAAYHAFLQQIVGFRAGRPKLFTALKSASQQVMETDAGEAYGVFQDVDAFAGVKTPHLLEGFQPRGYVEVVIVFEPVSKSPHSLFAEELAASDELGELQDVLALQLAAILARVA